MEISGKHFLFNNQLKNAADFSDGFLRRGRNIYEVVRVIEGVPLFLEDHIERLRKSARKSGLKITISLQNISGRLQSFIESTNFDRGNIKFVYHFEGADRVPFFIAYPIQHVYPEPKDYRQGVKTCILREERPDPNIKNWRPEFREKIRKLKAYKDVYEVLLVNENNIITEGSQSNVFIIRNQTVLTAREENILPGITRKYVFELCRRTGIPIREKDFGIEEIKQAEAVFLTGTSPMVLPVRQINDLEVNSSDKLLQKIMELYQKEVKQYINSHKK